MIEFEKRLALALRKFLAFEQASRRAAHFQTYKTMIMKGLSEEVVVSNPAELAAAKRLAAVGLLQESIQVIELQGFRKVQREFWFSHPLSETDQSGRHDQGALWTARPFGTHDALRFYSMGCAGIEWILADLQARYSAMQQTAPGEGRQLLRNISVLSRIWSVSLFWSLTRSARADEETLETLGWLQEPVARDKPRRPIPKEKLGLAKLPDCFQYGRIKATAQYMRSH